MFFSLFAINAGFAGFTFLFMVLEVGIFLLVLKITISKDLLEGDQFINNMLLIDYLKYYVIMIISAVVLTITVYIIYCFCAMLKCFSEKKLLLQMMKEMSMLNSEILWNIIQEDLNM